MKSNLARLTFVVALWNLGGCTGIQTGGEMGGSDCEEHRVRIQPEDETPIGVSPSQVLPIAVRARTAPTRYAVPAGSGYTLTPPSSDTQMHLSVQVDESSIYFVDLEPGKGRELIAHCEDFLAIGATLTLTSDDGAFNEVIPTEFTTTRADRLTSRISLPGTDVRGTFALSNGQADDRARFTYQINQVFEAELWLGTLRATYQADANSAGGPVRPVVDWGAAPCDPGATPIDALDPIRGPLVAQLQSTIEQAPVEFAFSDGTNGTATVRFEQTPTACRVVDSSLAPEMEDSILVSAPLAIRLADGRWTGTIPAHVVARLRDGQLETLRFFIDAPTLGKDEFESYYGFTGIDFGIHDVARLSFGVEYAVTGEPRATSGYFEISAPNDGVCADCAKGTAETLLGATVGMVGVK